MRYLSYSVPKLAQKITFQREMSNADTKSTIKSGEKRQTGQTPPTCTHLRGGIVYFEPPPQQELLMPSVVHLEPIDPRNTKMGLFKRRWYPCLV